MLAPTPILDGLWSECLSTREVIARNSSQPLPAPFWSSADIMFSSFDKRFMLVGRATKGDYAHEAFRKALDISAESALEERKAFNRHLVQDHPKGSAFWKCFVQGSTLCGATDLFENSVWTNLAKIGFAEQDVNSKLFSEQEELARRVLKAELETYDPTLVHFAVGRLGGECILSVTGSREKEWERLTPDGPGKRHLVSGCWKAKNVMDSASKLGS